MGAIIKLNAWEAERRLQAQPRFIAGKGTCDGAEAAVPRKGRIVSRVSVCENGGARKYEHIVGQACDADEAR